MSESEKTFLKYLENMANEIKMSWLKDCDKTDSMNNANNIILSILSKDLSLEEIFNNEKILQYFMTDFMKDVIQNILVQPIVYGDNGDDIALELLYNIYKLFLKYHKKKYSTLFEKIRDIVNTDASNHSYFLPPNENRNINIKIENPKRKITSYTFNHNFFPDFIDTTKEKENIFKIGDDIDFLIRYEQSRTQIDRKAWVRGKIKEVDIENNNYVIECSEFNNDINIPIGSSEIVPGGKKTKDWEWRRNLKKYDVIDCYDRNKWYPSTICDVNETVLNNGYKRLTYKIGFRLYPKYFKNKNDEKDNYENYKCFWENKQLEKDSLNNEEYYGDSLNIDENISFYSKRIQIFQSYTNTQKDYMNQPTQYTVYGSRNKPTGNRMQIMNYELENDGEINEMNEDIFIYEKDGKKNYIFAKITNYSYYYALFWKKLSENDNVFEKFINIIKNKPNSEELFMVIYSLYYAMPYLHKQYLRENLDNFKNSILDFINNLDTKEIRNLPKDLIEIITKFLKKVNASLKLNENENISILDEITISLSIKMIKTSIFDKRIQGIKALSDYIDENDKNENSMKKLVELIQKKEIIKEIFGANYHSQIISKSNKILQLLLKYNEVKEDDIKLIWDCTQRGDLEAKTTIMKLLSNLAENLNESFINILLQSIINSIDKNKINEKEIDFIYNLSMQGNNENNKNKCCEYLYQCILKLELDDNIQKNPIMKKLVRLSGQDDKYLDKFLTMCFDDLKHNNSSLIVFQIISAILDRYALIDTEIKYMKDHLKEYTKNDKLLISFKNNFDDYIKRIKEKIESEKNVTSVENKNKIVNYDKIIIDNFSHVINVQKRIEFLKDWIIQIYPNFDFVEYLKGILLDNPISVNDGVMFYDFMKKYISEIKANESKEQKEKRNNIINQLFKIFIEKNQNSMTISEFKLFMAIFLGINDNYLVYNVDKDDNYDIHVICDIEELKEIDKLWNVIFQLKNDEVLNKSICAIFNIYKNKNQIDKLLTKCSELIKDKNTTSEKISKCFKILRAIIIESEKDNILKTKSHSNLIKNSIIYLPLNLRLKILLNSGFYYHENDNERNSKNKENIAEIFYGNTTINEIKGLLIEKGNIPLKYIEINLSKEYLKKLKLKEIDNIIKGKEKSIKDKDFDNLDDKVLDETYNNKSIMEILGNNYNIDFPTNKIFNFNKKKIIKVNLLEGNELNPKLKEILKEWFNEFTEGTGKMDAKACSIYISKVTTTKEQVPEGDDRIKKFFETYDKEGLGYVTEDKFLEFYLDSLNNNREATVWENLTSMGIREDLKKKDKPEMIPYIENSKLPRYSLGNDKAFIDTLFNIYNKFEIKKEIFEFLFFLSTNQEIYDNIINNLNKKEEKNYEKIFKDKNKKLEQLYVLIIIESILKDINANNIDFSSLFEKFVNNDEKTEAKIVLKSKKYEYFDDISINKKKEFLKELITNSNFEKLINYMNNLLIEYKIDSKQENKNIALNLCFETCFKIINIIYNACFSVGNKENKEKESNSNSNGIILLDCDLSKIIEEDENIKNIISKINFLDFTTNLIKFISEMNNYLNINESKQNNDNNKNLLENSFNLLINLISNNETLLKEFDSKDKKKHMLISSIKSSITCKNEYYKTFYVKCLLNSIRGITTSQTINNKFLNLLFDVTNDIFNEMLTEKNDDNNSSMTSKNSILFFDFFSLLSSTKTDSSGKEFLFKIYNILFNNLKGIETDKKISKENFVGLMNILIKRIKNNKDIKIEIMNKEIEGKTLIDIIFEKLYKDEENKKELIEKVDTEEDNNPFINIDKIKKDKPNTNQSISKDIKNICNDYLVECFKSNKDSKLINELISIMKIFNDKISNENEESGQPKKKASTSTKNYGHVGLDNIGCICYMNSIMQQIYMVPTFRYAILGCDDHETPKPSEYGRMSTKDDNLLHQLQIMYTYLSFSEKEDFNPLYFCFSFKDFDGNPTNPMIQQDSQEFFNNFCDKIENCLKKTKYKYIINDVFTGRTCSSVICESCKHVSNRFEDFYNLSLEVKNLNNLSDSLQKMISPEKIDDFKCSHCNKNVTISKRTSLCNLPNILFVHLKRFYMNYEIERTEKINSRFEFPMNLDLKKFCIEDIVTQITGKQFEDEDIYTKEDEYYNYELKGINIHMGSADGGHYFSLIDIERNGKGNILLDHEKTKGESTEGDKKYKWLKFNDSHVSIFDINDIEKECFGGARKGSGYNYENFQNAYMLIYERKKKAPIRIVYEESDIKGIDKDKINEKECIQININNRKGIKKEYDLFRKNSIVDENNLYNKLFKDEEKNELYKYIPYYNIEKLAPRKIYNEVMEKNKKIEEAKNKSEDDDNRYKKEYNDVLLENISAHEFNILSDNYDEHIKKDLIKLLLHSIFSSNENKYLQEDEKLALNSKTKIILDKIILPFISPCFENEKEGKNEMELNNRIINDKNIIIILKISNILIQKEKLEKIYVNDLTAVFDKENVELFSKIIKGMLVYFKIKNLSKYLSIIDTLLELVKSVENTSTYPSITNYETSITPLYYIYKMIYEITLNDSKATEKLLNLSAIYIFLSKIKSETSLCRNVIYDILKYLIKNTDEYNDKLFDVDNNEKICNAFFHEKNYLIKNIQSSFVELLFDEKIDLLIILIKILQYNEKQFSIEFNIENIYNLFEYSFKTNKIMRMIKILYAILEINDNYSFQRINNILGFPLMIIKQNNYKREKDEEEKKENEEENKQKEDKNYWPLFGERLIEENDKASNNLENKLKKHIFKYSSIIQGKPSYCVLSLLFPYEGIDDKNDLDDNEQIIEQKERIRLIYDLLKLMLLGRGNYCLFKYIYLLPSRTLYYKNLYEEMIDIIEKENKSNGNLYNLEEIKKNGEMCIKRINYEVDNSLKNLKNGNSTGYEHCKYNNEYKLPEIMNKYYVNSGEVQKFIGTNPNMLPSDIVKEEIQIIAAGDNMQLVRLEYFTKYKSIEEIRNNLIKKNDKKKELNKEKEEEEYIKEEEKREDEEQKNEKKDLNEENGLEGNSDDDEDRIFKVKISNVDMEIDGKEFMFNIKNKFNSYNKIVIFDPSINDKKNVKSSLIRFIIISTQSTDSNLHIRISEKNIKMDTKENYYYPEFFVDGIRRRNISNFSNIYRIRNDLPFLKNNDIGINIDVKN